MVALCLFDLFVIYFGWLVCVLVFYVWFWIWLAVFVRYYADCLLVMLIVMFELFGLLDL